ncbi:hypothetical protein Syun_024082 [Stephania yunnanensis]|uniref:Uncharacterized protein n=1 Tax=Stephania yunnanensis TaxID=152371 RepID=A0AAP0FB39_9MAGN
MEICGARCGPSQFPLSFYYRLADQLLSQAKEYREEKNLAHLYATLSTYCRHGKILRCTQNEESEVLALSFPLFWSFIGIYKDNSVLESVVQVDLSDGSSGFELPKSTASMAWDFDTHCVTQSSPSPSISRTEIVSQDAVVSHISGSGSGLDSAKSSYQDIHLSGRLMEDFLELAKVNTNKDLETCGILGAFLCQALNEEEIFEILNEQSLFPIGWIHIMLRDAVAIVMAPTDSTRHYGIFRLSEPGGITIVRDCKERGFHTHQEPSDGRPIYEDCGNVYFNLNLRFEIFDLR